MISLKIEPWLLLRKPLFTYQEGVEKSLEDILLDNNFRLAIYFASKDLFSELEKNGFDTGKLSKRALISIKKYLNRMVYRSTPFGLFSSFSIVDWGEHEKKITLSNLQELQIEPDIRVSLEIIEYLKYKSDFQYSVIVNSSIYEINKQLRFFHYDIDNNSKRKFSIQTLEFNTFVKEIMSFCYTYKKFNDVLRFIQIKQQLEFESAKELLIKLLHVQFLIPECEPTITGGLLNNKLEKYLNENEIKILEQYEYKKDLSYFRTYVENCNACKPDQLSSYNAKKLISIDKNFYVNSKSNAFGCLATKYQNSIFDAVYALSKFSYQTELSSLNDFKKLFVKKFDNQVIPLLHALDPEVGISYNNLAQYSDEGSLLGNIKKTRKVSQATNILWDSVKVTIMEKWLKINGEIIFLSDEDISKLSNDNVINLPPSLPIIFKIYNNQIIVEQIGGNSATALLGRFTVIDDALCTKSRIIAKQESANNENIFFAEISHLSDGRTDNINQRAQIRDYEISILQGPVAEDSEEIKLSDLYIQIRNDEIILWSLKLDKPIVPRLSSAFNYKRDDLAIFQFLCDLQYQGLNYHLQLDLVQMFPNLNHYPRVEFKHCILSLATWIINVSDIIHLYKLDSDSRFFSFKCYCASINLAKEFFITNSDQYLVFNSDSKESVELFFSIIKQMTTITIKEYLTEFKTDGSVVNEMGDTFANEFIAFIVNESSSYPKAYVKPLLNSHSKTQRNYNIGSEWFYIKIYCHYFNSNIVLLKINKIIENLINSKSVQKWFFIRYNDPECHLRIRLKIDKSKIANVIEQFNKVLEGLERSGKVISVQLNTYERELERYGADNMELSEDYFCVSSKIVLRSLMQPINTTSYTDTYFIALSTIHLLLNLAIPNDQDRINFIKKMLDAFVIEMGGQRTLKNALNLKNRQLKNQVYEILSENLTEESPPFLFGYKRQILLILNQIHNIRNNNLSILSDYIHMHVNRVFATNQREYEMVVYSLLYSFEKSKMKRIN